MANEIPGDSDSDLDPELGDSDRQVSGSDSRSDVSDLQQVD